MAPRIPGIGAHHSANPQTDERLTPRHVLDALGHFDLDPCAPHDRPDWTGTDRSYTAEMDGLSLPWEGLVYMNPPYSDAGTWMKRLAGHPAGGVALVFARCDTGWWFEHVWPHARAYLFLRGRLSFIRGDGTHARAGHNAGGPSVLIAYGADAADRLYHCGLEGAFVAQARMSTSGDR